AFQLQPVSVQHQRCARICSGPAFDGQVCNDVRRVARQPEREMNLRDEIVAWPVVFEPEHLAGICTHMFSIPSATGFSWADGAVTLAQDNPVRVLYMIGACVGKPTTGDQTLAPPEDAGQLNTPTHEHSGRPLTAISLKITS